MIFLYNPKTGNRVPVDAETVSENEDVYDPQAGHVSHFTTCPDADKFGRKAKKKL